MIGVMNESIKNNILLYFQYLKMKIFGLNYKFVMIFKSFFHPYRNHRSCSSRKINSCKSNFWSSGIVALLSVKRNHILEF